LGDIPLREFYNIFGEIISIPGKHDLLDFLEGWLRNESHTIIGLVNRADRVKINLEPAGD